MSQISETVKILIIINIILFVGTLSMPGTLEQLFALYYYENPSFRFWQYLTHMFMHANIPHLAFNMLALWMFGTPLERQWGSKKFLFFYLSAGLGAALVYTVANYIQFQMDLKVLLDAGYTREVIYTALEDGRNVFPQFGPMLEEYFTTAVGASGAVYGVLVAFAMAYPDAKLMLIFLPIPIKAKYFVPILLLLDTFGGVFGSPLGIAHWAHVGGALFGFMMAWSWRKQQFNHFN